LEVPDLGPFPGTGKIDLKIVAVDQDGTPLKQGGDQFTASITVKGQPEVYTQTRTGRKCDYWQSKSWTLVWIRRFALFCFDDFPFAAELTLIVGWATIFILYLDSLPSSYSTPGSYTIPSNTALAGSQNNWDFENVQVFRVI